MAPIHNAPTARERRRKVFYFNHLRHAIPTVSTLILQQRNRTTIGAAVITIKSIQVANVITEGDPDTRDVLSRRWTTGFYKQPVPGPVEVRALGITGDAVADTQNHGGIDKAILCYANSHYAAWNTEHPELNMSAGGLGENLTLDGAVESSVCIGDRYRVGNCELEISQPRQPCWKIARRWGVKTLTKEVTQTGRTGWYVRVVREGTLDTGDTFELLDRPHDDWTVARANNVLFGREVDRMAVIELMSLEKLADAWKKDIA